MKPIYAKPKKIPTIPLSHPLEASQTAGNHPTGDAFFKNQIATVSPQYDADVKTGRALALGATNDLAIPIHYTLGANYYSGTITCGAIDSTVTDLGEGNWRVATTTVVSGNRTITFSASPSLTADDEYLFSFNAIINEGTFGFQAYWNGSTIITFPEPIIITDGYNEFILPDLTTDRTLMSFYLLEGNTFSVDILDTSMNDTSEISMANSFLTYHDIANDEIIQIGNAVDGGSKELVVNGDFSDGTTNGWSPDVFSGGIFPTIENIGNQIAITNGNFTYGVIVQEVPVIAGKSYQVSCEWISGTTTIRTMAFRVGTTNKGYDIGNFSTNVNALGVYTYEVTAITDSMFISVGTGGTGWENQTVVLDNITVKEILPTSTEYILNDVTVSNILTHQMPFSEGDLTLIQQEPNLLAALAMGEATPISSVTLDADDSWYACSEVSGADVFDARA